jgi:hypothetical protein
VLNCLSRLIAHSAPSFLSFRLILVFSPYLDSLILSLLSCLFVALFLSLSSTFIHLPFALNLSTSLLTYPFLSFFSMFFFSPVFGYYLTLFPSIHFVFKLCHFLSRFHFLYLLLFLPSPDLCPVHQYTLYHALEHHHSPPEITSPFSPSYSPKTSHCLICFPHYLPDMCLSRGSFVECVTQVFQLISCSFFLPSQFHSFSSFFLFLFLNTIIFVFSTFTSSFSFLRYFPRFFIISFISLSLFATITKSFANARVIYRK